MHKRRGKPFTAASQSQRLQQREDGKPSAAAAQASRARAGSGGPQGQSWQQGKNEQRPSWSSTRKLGPRQHVLKDGRWPAQASFCPCSKFCPARAKAWRPAGRDGAVRGGAGGVRRARRAGGCWWQWVRRRWRNLWPGRRRLRSEHTSRGQDCRHGQQKEPLLHNP